VCQLAARQATAESRTTLGLSQPPGASVRAPWRTRTGAVSTFPVTASRSTARTPAASLPVREVAGIFCPHTLLTTAQPSLRGKEAVPMNEDETIMHLVVQVLGADGIT